MLENQTNWAGNYTYHAARLLRPETIEQIQEGVNRGRQVKVLGTRHSFNHIADTLGDLISLEHFQQVIAFDREQRTVPVEAGLRYGPLCQYLHQAGYALHNFASLPPLSLAG